MKVVRVVIVEDEPLYRSLLQEALAGQACIEVAGAFPDGESALAAAPRLRPGAALIDIELGTGMNGIQLGLALRRTFPTIGIVLLSNHRDLAFLSAVPPAQAAGWSYLLKKSVHDVQALVRTIEGSAQGFMVLDPLLVSSSRPREDGPLSRLTPRQREVLELLASGFTNAAIADRLRVSLKAVENQINVLYQELGIDRSNRFLQPRVKAVLLYLQHTRQAD